MIRLVVASVLAVTVSCVFVYRGLAQDGDCPESHYDIPPNADSDVLRAYYIGANNGYLAGCLDTMMRVGSTGVVGSNPFSSRISSQSTGSGYAGGIIALVPYSNTDGAAPLVWRNGSGSSDYEQVLQALGEGTLQALEGDAPLVILPQSWANNPELVEDWLQQQLRDMERLPATE